MSKPTQSKKDPKGSVSRLRQHSTEVDKSIIPPTQYSISSILGDLTNFMVWESQQEWEPDYDRKANRKNSQDIAERKLNQLIYTQVLELIGEDEHKTKEYPVMKGSIDPSPTGTLPMLMYDPNLISRNKLRAELRAKAKAKYIGQPDED